MLDSLLKNVSFRPEFILATVDRFHYLHFGAMSFAVVCLVALAVSLLTPPPGPARDGNF